MIEHFLRLKTPSGTMLSVKVHPWDTIDEIKQRLAEQVHIEPRLQRILWKGRPLAGDVTLAECGMISGSAAQCEPSLRVDAWWPEFREALDAFWLRRGEFPTISRDGRFERWSPLPEFARQFAYVRARDDLDVYDADPWEDETVSGRCFWWSALAGTLTAIGLAGILAALVNATVAPLDSV